MTFSVNCMLCNEGVKLRSYLIQVLMLGDDLRTELDDGIRCVHAELSQLCVLLSERGSDRLRGKILNAT